MAANVDHISSLLFDFRSKIREMRSWSFGYAFFEKREQMAAYMDRFIYSRIKPELREDHATLSAHVETLMQIVIKSGAHWGRFTRMVDKAFPKHKED